MEINNQQAGRPLISVAICTYNRWSLLKRTLDSLFSQSAPSAINWELLVIDNASTDSTASEVKALLPAHPELKYFSEPNPGISFARNKALRKFRGDLLCFLDDDATVEKDYIEKIYKAWKDEEWGMAGGRIVSDFQIEPPAWVKKLPPRLTNGPLCVFDNGEQHELMKPYAVPTGCNMLLTREAIKLIGDFDTALGRKGKSLRGGDDTSYGLRAWKAGLKIGYCGSITVRHYVSDERLNRWYFIRWKFHAALYGEDEKLEPGTKIIFGVPRFLYKDLAVAAWRFLVSIFCGAAFQRLLELIGAFGSLAGFLTGKRKAQFEK